MKHLLNTKITPLLAALLLLVACKVDTSEYIKDLTPMVSLVQTQGGMITLKPEAMTVDKENLLVKSIFGVAYAGFAANEAFTASVTLDNNSLPNGYGAFKPGECYLSSTAGGKDNITTVEVAAGAKQQAFYFNITKAAIDVYTGKKMAAKIKLLSVSKYTLNNINDSVLLLIDMNDFGTVKKDITETYIKNASFKRAPGTTARFCNLADWLANDAVTNSRPTGAGYDDNVGMMGIERWGSWDNPIINGKIYQSFNLAKGNYRFELTMGQVIPDLNTYFAVAANNELPNHTQIATAIASQAITADYNRALLPLDFKLAADQKVTAGFLLNFDQGLQKVLQTASIKLFKLESLFD